MATATLPPGTTVEQLLGDQAASLLEHRCETVAQSLLHLPGPDFVDRIWTGTDRSSQVLRNLSSIYGHGRLANTGYVSILPVDQGIEHSAGASFAPNPEYFDPARHHRARHRRGLQRCGVDVRRARGGLEKCAHKIPFIVKINHNELLTYPNGVRPDPVRHGQGGMEPRCRRGGGHHLLRFGRGRPADRQEISRAFAEAHSLGMATILWCYLRNSAFKKDGVDYAVAADLTGQANHLGVTIEADIIKQKLPTTNGGFVALNFGKTAEAVYTKLTSDHPIDLCRYQVLNCYAGRVGLINSGGESIGASDLAAAVRTAVINKRAGGTGLISGRKAFQKPMRDGVELLTAIQDVYLASAITVA